jgi:hypothetical protein
VDEAYHDPEVALVDASATVRMLHQTQEKGLAGNFAGHDLAGEQSADDVNYNRLLGALSKGIRFYDHGALVRISLRGGSTLSMMCTLSASFLRSLSIERALVHRPHSVRAVGEREICRWNCGGAAPRAAIFSTIEIF